MIENSTIAVEEEGDTTPVSPSMVMYPVPEKIPTVWRRCYLKSRKAPRRPKVCPYFHDRCTNIACVHGKDGYFKDCHTYDRLKEDDCQLMKVESSPAEEATVQVILKAREKGVVSDE